MRSTVLILAAVTGAVALAGCESNYTYQKIGYGPGVEYAKAKCELMAGSVDQGYVAYGSTDFVVGAAIGNGIGNAIREDQFVKRCMILQGWKRVPTPTSTTSRYRTAQLQAARANRHHTGNFPPPPKD